MAYELMLDGKRFYSDKSSVFVEFHQRGYLGKGFKVLDSKNCSDIVDEIR